MGDYSCSSGINFPSIELFLRVFINGNSVPFPVILNEAKWNEQSPKFFARFFKKAYSTSFFLRAIATA
jgi:hypothetical protein